jgi:hypothetical protein
MGKPPLAKGYEQKNRQFRAELPDMIDKIHQISGKLFEAARVIGQSPCHERILANRGLG